MILSISQPTLYPWIGFFVIIKKSDSFESIYNQLKVHSSNEAYELRETIEFIMERKK